MKKLLLIFLMIPFLGIAQTTEENNAATEATKAVDSVTSQNQLPQEKPEKLIAKPECVSGDCKNGKGEMKFPSGTYNGDWKDGLRSGQGKYTWNNGDVYTGAWLNDKRHGYGEYLWHDGSKYKGNYSHGIRSGYGVYYYSNGSIYEGTWQNNLKHGIANFYYKESVNIGGKYFNNEYVSGTGITQESYKHKPTN